MIPSRHLWLGNVTQKPTDDAVLEVFAAFGKVDSVRVFPVKAYAFVNYAEIASAIKAMSALEGVAIPALTGVCGVVCGVGCKNGLLGWDGQCAPG